MLTDAYFKYQTIILQNNNILSMPVHCKLIFFGNDNLGFIYADTQIGITMATKTQSLIE